MTDFDGKLFESTYGMLPYGLMILTEDFKPAYYNESYRQMLEAGSHEFGNWEGTHAEILKSIETNQNKSMGTIRFVNKDKSKPSIFRVFIHFSKNYELLNEPAFIFTVLPENRSDSYFVSQKRETYIHGMIRLNIDLQTAKYGREFIALSPQEYKIFSFLVRNEDRLCSKEELLREVWGARYKNTRTVDIYVNRVRKKLTQVGCRRNYIRTIHGRGFVFVSEPEK